jgi:hypothetical protein
LDFDVKRICRFARHIETAMTMSGYHGLDQAPPRLRPSAVAPLGAEGRHLAPRAFRQTGKTALRFDPVGWSRRSGFIQHRGNQRSAAGFIPRQA